MDLLDIASNINEAHQGCISTLVGSLVFFLGAHLDTRGVLDFLASFPIWAIQAYAEKHSNI